MTRRVIACLAAALLAAGLGVFTSVQAHAADLPSGTLSETGALAVQDLRECLSSNPKRALDVYYLIDASGSLWDREVNRVVIPGTDPDFQRAEILQNSLIELAKLSESFTVQYAAGFFGSGFVPSSGWHQVDAQENGQALADEIRATPEMGTTNWEAAIDGAAKALAEKWKESKGCQMLIWLTDGAINLSGDSSNTDSAINNLCGNSVAEGGASPTKGLGQFNDLRAAHVSVFGTLLNVSNSLTDEDIGYMQAMVEGISPTTNTVCGEVPVPKNYSNGAYIQATDTTQLSRVFLGLSEAIGGGRLSDIGADGTFTIDPGVAGFSIVSTDSGTWSLTPPNSFGPLVSNGDMVDDSVLVTSSAGALLVSWPSTGAAPASGKWTFVSTNDPSPQLYRFSGLSLTLDPPPRVIAQSPVTLTGTIARDGSEPLGLNNYNYTLTLSKRVAGTTELTEIDTVQADADSGVFSYEYTDEGPEGQYDIVASLTGLSTRANGLALADLSTSLPVDVEVPEQFPTIGTQPVMTDLVGSTGESIGTFTIVGPSEAGATGKACFPEALVPIDSPSAARDDAWVTSVTVDGRPIAPSDCIEVNNGETKTVHLAMSNSTAANSTVRASLPVALTPAEGEALVQSVDVSVNSTLPLNQSIFWGVLLLLMALGLAIPVALLYLVNFVTAKIGHGAKLQRASFPVTVAPDGTLSARSGVNLRGSTVGTDDFKFLPPKPDARTLSDVELGALTASPPGNPFGDVVYVLAPAAGLLVFTMGKGGAESAKQEFRTARKATFNGHMSTLAALTVSEVDFMEKGAREPVNGTLVVYSKSPGATQPSYSTRMAEVLGTSRLRQRMANAREAIQVEQAGQPPKRRASTTAAGIAAPTGASVPSRTPQGRQEPPPPSLPERRSSSLQEPPPARRSAAPPAPGSAGARRTNAGRGASSPPPSRGDEPPPPLPRRN